MLQKLIEQLKALRLSAMAWALRTQSEQPQLYADLGFEERLALLLDHEQTERDQRKLDRLIRGARFKLSARLESIDYHADRGLNRSQMATLHSGDWIAHHQNLLVTGPTGSGKSYLACAFGDRACRLGYRVRYERTSRLLEALTLAHGDGTFGKALRQLQRVDVLILDDFGLDPITSTQRHDLLEVMDDRHGLAATIVASQLPVTAWHQALGEATIADAILDRLIHNAHRVELKGESMRKRLARRDDQ